MLSAALAMFVCGCVGAFHCRVRVRVRVRVRANPNPNPNPNSVGEGEGAMEGRGSAGGRGSKPWVDSLWLYSPWPHLAEAGRSMALVRVRHYP